jgi:deazaflavin-dependent oxidoreductase (nitroreductase family)
VIPITVPPADASEARRTRAKRTTTRATEKYVVNRLIRGAVRRGLAPSAYALLETTGRKTGRVRRIPVANGVEGDTFWLISAHGRHSHYLHNIRADPRVRVGVRAGGTLHWRAGTAHLLPDDDSRARQRKLGRGRLAYRLDALLLRAVSTDLQTIRIDLDPP